MTTQYIYQVNNLDSDDTKSIKIKKGARVILAKSGSKYIPSKYTFEKEYFTQDEADAYVQRLGITAERSWGDIKESDYDLDQWKRACLIHIPDCEDSKACYKLPVRTPEGELHEGGLKAAFGVLRGSMGGVDAPSELKAKALKQIEGYYKELGIEHTVKASSPKGRIWSAGEHHVFVDGKPARVHVPKDTLKQTYDKMVSFIEANGSLKLGVDHLSDELLDDNGIIKKMNLLDVGEITDITMDDEGIYIKESNLTNALIDKLNIDGELNMYSIVGAMDARPCPTGKADYVLDDLDIERVDFVDEGGCRSCRLDAQPKDMVITAKLSMEAKDTMVDEIKDNTELSEIEQLKQRIAELEAAEQPAEDVPEEKPEDGVEPEEVEEEKQPEESEESEVVPEPEEKPEEEEDPMVKQIRELTDKISEMEQQLEGKKPKIEASEPTWDIEKAVDDLVGMGRATPKMREALIEYGAVSKDAFDKIAASLPVVVDLKVQAKFARQNKKNEEEEAKEAERKRIMELMGV